MQCKGVAQLVGFMASTPGLLGMYAFAFETGFNKRANCSLIQRYSCIRHRTHLRITWQRAAKAAAPFSELQQSWYGARGSAGLSPRAVRPLLYL